MNRIQRIALPVLAICVAFLVPTAPVMAQEEERVPGPLAGIGEDFWRAQPTCWDCHGNMANGRNEDPRSPAGANLRESLMDVATLALVIRCGLPGTPMPYFGGQRAYTDDPATSCYGTTLETLGAQAPPEGGESMNTRQIDGLAQFLIYQVAGKGPVTKEECVAFYGPTASSCNRWPTEAEVAAEAAAAE